MKVYRYFTGKDDVHFCARVTQALNEGYSLYGSPTMTFVLATVTPAVCCKYSQRPAPKSDATETHAILHNAAVLILTS